MREAGSTPDLLTCGYATLPSPAGSCRAGEEPPGGTSTQPTLPPASEESGLEPAAPARGDGVGVRVGFSGGVKVRVRTRVAKGGYGLESGAWRWPQAHRACQIACPSS